MNWKLLVAIDTILANAWYIIATFVPELFRRALLSLLLGIIISAGALGIMLPALSDIANSYRSAIWPQTTGQVIDARLEQRGDDFRTTISYRYQVGETSYSSETISFGNSRVSGRAEAEAIFARYPLGSTPSVAYHPSDPALACLEPGALPVDALSRVVIGGVLLLFGFRLLWGVLSSAGLVRHPPYTPDTMY